MYLFLQPVQRPVLTVSMKLELSDLWTQKHCPKRVAHTHKHPHSLTHDCVCVVFSFFKWELPFSSATWCREAREREHLSSLVQAGNSSSMTTWSTGWNFPWAPRYKAQWTNQILINLDLEKKRGAAPTIRNYSLHFKSFKREKPNKWGSQFCHFLPRLEDIREWKRNEFPVEDYYGCFSYLGARFVQVGQDQKERIHRSHEEKTSICFKEKSKVWGKKNWEWTDGSIIVADIILTIDGKTSPKGILLDMSNF